MDIFRTLKYLKFLYKLVKEFIDRTERHHLFMLAAGMSFNIILYILPLLLIIIYVLTFIFDAQNIISAITEFVNNFLPPNEATRKLISEIISEANSMLDKSSIFGIISIVILLWLSSAFIASLRYSLNTIFEIKTPNIFIFYRIKDIILIILFTIIILFYSFILPVLSVIISSFDAILSNELFGAFNQLILFLISIIVSFILFYLVFRFVPNKRLPRKPRIIATIISLVLLELSRYAFSWYLASISSYGTFYGAYAVLVSSAIWIYYSSLIILFSAEIAKLVHDIDQIQIDGIKQDFYNLD